MDPLSLVSWSGAMLTGYIVPFLFVLTIVVFFHELGHFLVARWCGVGVKVDRRSLAGLTNTGRAGGFRGFRLAAM